jgi:hypothetical protein
MNALEKSLQVSRGTAENVHCSSSKVPTIIHQSRPDLQNLKEMCMECHI